MECVQSRAISITCEQREILVADKGALLHDQLHGQTNHAPDLRDQALQAETDGVLFWRITNGNSRKGMPSFSSLPETQRWQLVLYIRSMAPPPK